MNIIKTNKQYGEDDYTVMWAITGHGEKCVKLTKTIDDDGDVEKHTYFIKNEDVFAENKIAIAFAIGAIPELNKSAFANERDYVGTHTDFRSVEEKNKAVKELAIIAIEKALQNQDVFDAWVKQQKRA